MTASTHDGDRADGDALRRARALAAPTRVAVLDTLRASDRPLTPQEIAERLGVHHTAVRQHLALLEEAGLTAPVPLPPAGRGRPKVAHRALSDPEPYRHLARALAEALAQGGSARDAGRRRGSEAASAAGSPDDAIGPLVAETEWLGFQPRVRARGAGLFELVLQHCPFADVATAHQDIVCGYHLGIAEGVLGEGSPLEVVELKVADPHRAGCRLVVRARGAAT